MLKTTNLTTCSSMQIQKLSKQVASCSDVRLLKPNFKLFEKFDCISLSSKDSQIKSDWFSYCNIVTIWLIIKLHPSLYMIDDLATPLSTSYWVFGLYIHTWCAMVELQLCNKDDMIEMWPIVWCLTSLHWICYVFSTIQKVKKNNIAIKRYC